MPDLLCPIPIQELKLLDKGVVWQIDQTIEDLETLTPVRGHLQVRHQGNVLEVEGEAKTIVTLCCDRCLQHFNHALSAEAEELLWLGDSAGEAAEVLEITGAFGDQAACEHLDPRGNFNPERWVFEQLSLQLPLVNNCGSECPGPPTWSSQACSQDPRWAALGQLNV